MNEQEFKYVPVTKRTDKKSERNIGRIKNLPCAICGFPPPSDAHHIVSRGAGGGDDLPNIISLCRAHHNEVHSKGKKTFYRTHKHQIMSHRETFSLPKARF